MGNPDQKVSELNLLPSGDEKKLLLDFNETKADYEVDALLHELIETVSAVKDEDTAVIFGDTHVTYGELNRLANGVARDLSAARVSAGDNVGVLADRSPKMIAALL